MLGGGGLGWRVGLWAGGWGEWHKENPPQKKNTYPQSDGQAHFNGELGAKKSQKEPKTAKLEPNWSQL